MQTTPHTRFPRAFSSGRSVPADDDYRVKIYKAASRSAHDEVERATAALGERTAADRERARARREAEVRERRER
jgi:hypothetical protein